MANRIFVESERAAFRALEAEAAVVVRRALKQLRKDGCAIELAFVTNETMRKENKKFRGKDTPTTILSFDARIGFPRPDVGTKRYLGELLIAPRFVAFRKQSLKLLLVHGILHLLGYTHGVRRARIRMERRERSICRALGIS